MNVNSLRDVSPELYRLMHILEEYPLDSKARVGAGLECIRLGWYSDAGELLAEALKGSAVAKRHAYHAMSLLYRAQEDSLRERELLDEALGCYPDDTRLRNQSGSWHLLHGNWRAGWAEFALGGSRQRFFPACRGIERWRGEEIDGGRLLIGDNGRCCDLVLFSGYLQAMMNRGIFPIVLSSAPSMARFVARLGLSTLTSNLEIEETISSFSETYRYADLTDLPGLLGLWAPVPSATYCPEPDESAKFARLFESATELKVGLCWYDSGTAVEPDLRDSIQKLLGLPGPCFYGFRFGGMPLPEGKLVDIRTHCHDAADMAAALAHVDTVIALDGLGAHIAASMRKPVMLLKTRPWDWCWGFTLNTSPWYPTMEILRHDEHGRWEHAINRAIMSLQSTPCTTRLPAKVSGVFDPLARRVCRYGSTSFYTTDHYVGRSLELYGEFSQGEVNLCSRLLAPGDTVIDAGANIGALTVALSEMVGPAGRVHAFEPQSDLFDLLKRNVAHLRQAVAWPYALASAPGTVKYTQQARSKICNPGGCQVSANGTFTHCETAQAVRADDILPSSRVHMIKADVEGGELELLKGAKNLISRFRPLLYLEDDRIENRKALHEWIQGWHYKLYRHTPALFNSKNWARNPVNVFGETVSINLLCIPAEKAEALTLAHSMIAEKAAIGTLSFL